MEKDEHTPETYSFPHTYAFQYAYAWYWRGLLPGGKEVIAMIIYYSSSVWFSIRIQAMVKTVSREEKVHYKGFNQTPTENNLSWSSEDKK